jgi:hypothetical protein
MKGSIVGLALIAIITASCGGNMSPSNQSLPDFGNVPDSAWKTLAGKRILFGHQSVGGNILKGIGEIGLPSGDGPLTVTVKEITGGNPIDAPGISHFRVGKNVDPASKIDHFAEFVERGGGSGIEVAFFKFCYVDFNRNTNPGKLFERYKTTMSALKSKYPGTIFVHVTAPLTVSKENYKTWIKKIVGRGDLWEYGDNVKRNEFNELLMKEYAGREPVFDLAASEATYPDGKQASFQWKDKRYYSMVPAYSKDGGHLNETGRIVVAKRLLAFLATETGKGR